MWGAIAGVGTSLIGMGFDAANSAADRALSREQFEQNRWDKYAMYQDQKAYSTHMANTAYQRQKADMEAAGINPMLAVMKGGGAPTPNVSPSPVQGMSPVVNRPSIAQALTQAIGTAAQTAKVGQEIRESESRVALQAAERETELTKQKFNTASAVNALAGSRLSSQKVEHLASELGAVKQEAKTREKKAFIDEEMAVPDAVGSRAGKVIDGVLRAISPFRSSAKSQFDDHFTGRKRSYEDLRRNKR